MIPFAIPAILKANWKPLLGLGLLLAMGIYVAVLKMDNRHLRTKVAHREAQITAIVASYKAAGEAQKRAQDSNIARVRTEQEAISEKAVSGLSARVDDYRGRFERLRAQRASGGASSGHQVPATGQSPGSPTPANRDPGDAATVAVRIDDLETLVNGALQGEALRLWALAQEVVVNSPDAP